MDATRSTPSEVVIMGKHIQEVERECSTEDLLEDRLLIGDEDITELFNRLSAADDAAQKMEQKLDAVLENLDKLLDVLDPEAASDLPTGDARKGTDTAGAC